MHQGITRRSADTLVLLVVGPVLESNDALGRSRLRVSPLQDFGLHPNRISVKERSRKGNFAETEIRHRRAEGGLVDADPDHDAEGQHRIDQGLAKFCFVLRVVKVEMKPGRVHRHRRKGDVIRLGQCPSDRMLNDQSRNEFLEPLARMRSRNGRLGIRRTGFGSQLTSSLARLPDWPLRSDLSHPVRRRLGNRPSQTQNTAGLCGQGFIDHLSFEVDGGDPRS